MAFQRLFITLAEMEVSSYCLQKKSPLQYICNSTKTIICFYEAALALKPLECRFLCRDTGDRFGEATAPDDRDCLGQDVVEKGGDCGIMLQDWTRLVTGQNVFLGNMYSKPS